MRSDIRDQIGADIPTTYEEVLEVLAAMREAGIMEHPWAMNTASGWNLGEEFVNMMMGMGWALFEPRSAQPAARSEEGRAVW